jgi:4-hydroxybenzoate polyprenyltransferase
MVRIKHYFSLVKFSHTIFAMPFALIGFFLAVKTTEIKMIDNEIIRLLIFVVLDMIFARNAAMGFNRWLDRKIDANNPRTSIREIPSGKIKSKFALWFVLINSVLFFITTYQINGLVFYLSPIALIVILGYSYTKRFTWLCHFILGLGLSLAPVGSYLAVTGEFSLLPLLFSLTVLFWTAGFDIIYALQDEDFDKENKLKSLPAVLGKSRALQLSTLLHIITIGIIVWTGITGAEFLGIWYWSGAIFFGSSLVYQHLIVKPNDLSKVNLAFFTTNGVASIVFASTTVLNLYVN